MRRQNFPITVPCVAWEYILHNSYSPAVPQLLQKLSIGARSFQQFTLLHFVGSTLILSPTPDMILLYECFEAHSQVSENMLPEIMTNLLLCVILSANMNHTLSAQGILQ